MNQVEKNEASKYEGVVLEQLAEFFSGYESAVKRTSYTAVKVMRLLGNWCFIKTDRADESIVQVLLQERPFRHVKLHLVRSP